MTIDEAIEHAEERACGNDQCAKDHAQLADWLRELRRARMEIDLLKTLRDGFKADAQKYKAENAKLRDDIKRLRSCLSDDAENARLLLGEVHELVALANRLGMMFHECYCVEKDKAFCDGECPYGVDDETCEITKAMDVLEKYGRAQANE